MAQEVIDMIKAHPKVINPDDLIFLNTKNKALSRTNVVERYFKKALRAAGLRHVTFHSLRHTFEVMTEQSGIPLKSMQAQMRHAYMSKTTLQDYGHALDKDKQKAANSVFGQVFSHISHTKNPETSEKSDISDN